MSIKLKHLFSVLTEKKKIKKLIYTIDFKFIYRA